MFRTLEALKPRFDEIEYMKEYYRERMACKGTGQNGHPKNSGSWAHDPEIYAMCTFLCCSIVMGVYRNNGTIGWVPYHPVTDGYSILSPDRNLDYGPAVYILHTGTNPSDPTPIGTANHYRVLMGVWKPSTIPGLASVAPSFISPPAARRQIPEPSTPKVSICFVIVFLYLNPQYIFDLLVFIM